MPGCILKSFQTVIRRPTNGWLAGSKASGFLTGQPLRELGSRESDLAKFYEEEIMKGGNKIGGITRRTVLIAGTTATTSFALRAGKVEAKIQQAGVKYQTEPKDGKQCSDCNFFIAPNACKQVDGEIAPTGYCLLWAKKPS
jgi:hypothetical protein